MQRRLAAILAADVVGYSKLMGDDETGTLAALRTLRGDLLAPSVQTHRGNLVKSMGDGWLVEFPSVGDAVNCAIAVQQALAAHNGLKLRVGVHIGDVTFEDEDIFGDGVNVAARLQEKAEPGNIMISDTAWRTIDGKLSEVFVDLGPQELKNIGKPVTAFAWGTGQAMHKPEPEILGLPDKPSIAVLPFSNLSGQEDQEYFSDGITEDIITALSSVKSFFVIARNSSFIYKGQAVDVRDVGQDMGVRYVLEGSVRKMGKRVRVSATLIEAETRSNIWAGRYDNEVLDLFDLQDELTVAICGALNFEIAENERGIAKQKKPTDLNAWDTYQRGMWHFYKFSKTEMGEARRQMKLAVELSPDFASAYAGLAFLAYSEVIFGYIQDPIATLGQGLKDAEKALLLDDKDAYCHFALGRVCSVIGDIERAISALERSIELNPNSAQAYYGYAMALAFAGRTEEAIEQCSIAIRLSPNDVQLWAFHNLRSMSYSFVGQFDAALQDGKRAIQAKGDEFWPQMALALAYSCIDQKDQAHAAFLRALELNPNLSTRDGITSLLRSLHPPHLAIFLEGIEKIGLLEESA